MDYLPNPDEPVATKPKSRFIGELKIEGSIENKIKSQLFRILNFGHCDLPFDLAQGGEVVSPSTLLRTVSLSNGLSNHLVFEIF
jgi:hypothetical protein